MSTKDKTTINGGNVGLTVSIHFDTKAAVSNLKTALNAVEGFKIKLDTSAFKEATEELKKIQDVKLNLEGQKEALKYFTSITKQLEKQLEASAKIRKNMIDAGDKTLTKRYLADQKELYSTSLKMIAEITNYEKQLLSLTGKEKEQMLGIIAARRQDLESIGQLIKYEDYQLLYTNKVKEMEAEITSEKLKQSEIEKNKAAAEKELKEKNQLAEKEKKNTERLKEAKAAYERIVELRLKIYELGKGTESAKPFQEELNGLVKLVNGYERAKDTKEELIKMKDDAEVSFQQGKVLIDNKRQKEEEKVATQQQKEAEKQLSTETKKRLDEAAVRLKRIADLKVQLHQLDKNSPAAAILREELKDQNIALGNLKKFKNTKEEIKKLEELSNKDTTRRMGLIDAEQEKRSIDELKKHLNSLGKNITDLYKSLGTSKGSKAQTRIAKTLKPLLEELETYRDIAAVQKEIQKIDKDIYTQRNIAYSKLDSEEAKQLQKEMDRDAAAAQRETNAWGSEFYSQYTKHLAEAAKLEQSIQDELVKTRGIKADTINLDNQTLESLKGQNDHIGVLAKNLLKVRENIEVFRELTVMPGYNNQVKDFRVSQQQDKIERDALAREQKRLEQQEKEAQSAEELILVKKQLLSIELQRLKNNEYLTAEQQESLGIIEQQIHALNGATKKEVSDQASAISTDLRLIKGEATLSKESLSIEDKIRAEAEYAKTLKNSTLRQLEKIEAGKLSAFVNKEDAESIRLLTDGLEGLGKKDLLSMKTKLSEGLKDLKHNAELLSQANDIYQKEADLGKYTARMKEVLQDQLKSLKTEEMKGYVLKDNLKAIEAQINAIQGASKAEVDELARKAKKAIALEEEIALETKKRDLKQQESRDDVKNFYIDQENANKKAQFRAVEMQDIIKELKLQQNLTAEQREQIANLERLQQLMASGQILSMQDFNNTNNQFNSDLKHLKSDAKVTNTTQAQAEELRLAKELIATNKQKLKQQLELLMNGNKAQYVDQERLRIAYEMIDALDGQNRKQVRDNTGSVRDYIGTLTHDATIARMRNMGTAVDALRGSMGMLTRYFSGYMLINRFFTEFQEGLSVIRELDETLTTLRITLTNFTEDELSNLMEASKELAVELKTSFTDVMNVIKTVANETESMTTIMAKATPALMLSNLTGLGTDQTVEMIQGVTRQYASQFEALGLTVEEQGMKVADSMVAVSRALGMDFATGVAGMAEGIEIMGALSNELGMTLEETISLMSATAEQTRLTFSEIANAFKTTMARTIRISGTEEEVSVDDLAKTERALRGVGVEVRNFATGELRSFIDIMDDLAVKWDDLTDSQRGAIGDAMGGARQISTIMASINVTDRRQELTKIAEESVGAAQVAQDTWSNSLEAKLKELSNAGAMFWQTFIDSESYHTFLESMTSLVNILTTVVDFFGSVPFVITTALTSFGLFNKGARDLITGLIFDAKRYIAIKKGQNIVDQQGVAVTLDSVKADTAKRIGLQSLTFEAIKAKVAAIALQGALTFGVPVVFGLIVKGIQSIINSAKEAKEAVSNLSQTLDTYDSNKESAEASRELIDEYKSLKTSLKDITRGTDEYAKALERLCEIEDELSNKSERFKSVLNDTALGQEEKIQMLEFYAKQDLINAAQTADEELAGWWSRNSTMNTVTKEAEEFEKERAKYKALVRKSNSEAARVYKKALKQGATEEEALAKATEAQEAVNADLLEAEKRMMTRVDSIQGLYDYMRRHNNQVSISEELLGESQSHKFSEKFFDYEGVVKETDELIKARNKDTKAIDKNVDSMKKAKKAVSEYKEKLKDLKSTYSEGRDSFVDETEKLQALKDLMDDINENGMTLDNFDHELLDDFKGNIADAAAVQAYLTEQIKLTEKAQGEAYGAMIENSEELFDSEVKNSEGYKTYLANVESSAQDIVSTLRAEGLDDLADHYADKIDMAKKDLQNSKSIAQSRAILEENLINGLQGAWFEYYEKVSDWELDYGNGLNPDGTYNEVAYEAWLKIQAYKKQLEEIANKIGQKIEITPPTITKPSSSSSSSSDKVDDLDLEIDRYHELNRAIQRINNALEKNKIAQENATPTKKLQLMKEEIELYKELREAQKALYAEQKKEASELKKKLSKNGFTFNDDGTVKNYKKRLEELEKQANKLSGDAKKAKIEEVKAIKDLVDAYEELINETIPETQQEYWELSNTIKEAQREQLEFVADLQSQLTDAITEELEKRYDATRKALEKEQELYNKQHEQEQWEDDYKKEVEKLAEIQAQVDALSRDFSESGRKKLEELLQQLQEQQEVVDQMWDDKLHEETNDRFDEALDELDKELEDALDAKNLAQMVDQALTNGFIKLDGEIIKTETLLTNMLENSGELFLATGKLIQTELIDGLKVAQGLMSDISSLTSSITGRSRSIELSSTYGLTPTLTTASIDTASLSSRASSINVSFDQLLNVEGNLDTTLMLDLENKLRQAMNEVTYSISQALTYR